MLARTLSNLRGKHRILLYTTTGYMLLIPLALVTPIYARTLLVQILLFISMTQAYNIMVVQGDLSFGPSAFFGAGAYTVALLTYYGYSVNPILDGMIGAGAAAVLAVGMGFPLLKLRGIYFAIGTLGLQEILRLLSLSSSLTNGGSGIIVPYSTYLSQYDVTFYFLIILGLTIAISILVYAVLNSKIGLAMTAIRDDVDSASSLGINPTAYRLLGFSLSGAIIGICGAFFAYYNGFVQPDNTFSLVISFTILTMAFFGGESTFLGPLVGAVSVLLIEEVGRSFLLQGYQIVLALLLVIIFLIMPGGIVGSITKKTPVVKPFGGLKRKRRKPNA